MKPEQIENIHIRRNRRLKAPVAYKKESPITPQLAAHVRSSREAIVRLLNRQDERLLMIVGPCSIHDYDLAIEYAQRLKKLAEEVERHILIVMRVYFEKPRTVMGWRGLIIDPHLDGTQIRRSEDLQPGERGQRLALKAPQRPVDAEAVGVAMHQKCIRHIFANDARGHTEYCSPN